MTSNYLKGRSLGQDRIRIIVSGQIWKYIEINSTFSSCYGKNGVWTFSHCLIMVRSQNWPDLRPSRLKLRDNALCRYWCLYQLLKVSYWYIKNCGHGAIKNIFWGRVTWPGLRWPWAEIFWKGAKLMYEKVCQKRVFHYSRKTRWCRQNNSQPHHHHH